MDRDMWARYSFILAVAAAALYVVGIPLSTVLFLAFVLAVPLMMLFTDEAGRNSDQPNGNSAPKHHHPPDRY